MFRAWGLGLRVLGDAYVRGLRFRDFGLCNGYLTSWNN